MLPWPPVRDAIPRDAGEQQGKDWENRKIPSRGLASCRDAPDHPTPRFFVGFPDILKGFCAWIPRDSSLPHGNSGFSTKKCSEPSFRLELGKRERNPSQSHVREIPNFSHHLSQGGTRSAFPHYPGKVREKLGMVFLGQVVPGSSARGGILPPLPEFFMENLSILLKLDSSSNSDMQNSRNLLIQRSFPIPAPCFPQLQGFNGFSRFFH